MSKLRLELESLAVETFDPVPSAARGGRGTVFGEQRVPGEMQQYASYPDCPSPLCVDTELASCNGSCQPTCRASCLGTCESCIATCNGGDTCFGSCYGTCDLTCADTCKQSCGPLCIPPDVVGVGM